MGTLSVPIPTVAWPAPSPEPELESPVQLGLTDVTYPDGSTVVPDQVLKMGAFVYRLSGAGEEIWNEADQEWQAVPADMSALAGLSPLPLTFKANDPRPWQGVLVAAGQKDKLGADRYTKAVGGLPRYRLRAFAKAQRDGAEHAGLSGVSPELAFLRSADAQRFVVVFDTDDTTPRDCTRARVQLKDPNLVVAGYLEIRASGREVEVASCDPGGNVRARVLLTADGDVLLAPASGRRIVLGAELEAENIHYRPLGALNKVYL